MENNNDSEREKLLLHSVVDTVKEHDEKISAVETVVENLHIDSPIPTKTSELDNDSGFVTASDLPSVPTRVSQLQNDSGFATQTDLQNLGEVVGQISDDVLGLQTSIPTKTSDLDNDSGFVTDSDLQTTINNLGENMINTTDLENGIDELNTTNSNGMNTLGTKIEALTVAVRGIGADFTQVEATPSDVKSGKKFFDENGLLQQGTIPTFEGETTITQNGTLETENTFVASNITVAVPRPQLNAPTLAISGDMLTITNPNTNGNFAVGFDVFANGELLCTTQNATVDLVDYLEDVGVYELTAKCKNIGFEDSNPSQSVSYSIAGNSTLTSIADITALNTQRDENNFNTSTHEKLPFTSKGANGPTAVIFFRQAPNVSLTPSITLKFFLRDIPQGVSKLACNVLLNNTTVTSQQLSIYTGLGFDASITLSNIPNTTAFNKLEIAFNDPALADMQLDYVDITISNTKNCIILNRDNTFSVETRLEANDRLLTVASNFVDGEYKYSQGYALTFNQIINPTKSFRQTGDNNGHSYQYVNIFSVCSQKGNTFIAFNSSSSFNLAVYLINETNELWKDYTVINSYNKKCDDVLQFSVSVHNGEINHTINLVSFFVGVHTNFMPFIRHSETSTQYYNPTLNQQNLPSEFVDAVGIKDVYMGLRETYVNNVGYFFVHKSGSILFFPRVNNTYCIKVGRGRQVNAYLSEDGLSINVYYNLDNKVIKKTLTRPQILDDSVWTLQDSITEYQNMKDLRELYNNYIYLDLNNTWQQNT